MVSTIVLNPHHFWTHIIVCQNQECTINVFHLTLINMVGKLNIIIMLTFKKNEVSNVDLLINLHKFNLHKKNTVIRGSFFPH